jgi:small subunit ribosomal protein SAe
MAEKHQTWINPSDDDIRRLLSCKVHVGTKNLVNPMAKYVYARRKDGIHVIDLHATWQKLMLAARIIVAIENPADVCVISARPYGQRAVLKYAQYTGAQYTAGRFTPGTLTNQIQDRFMQPRLLIVTDPRTDHQPITESGYGNIPIIAFCDTDSPLNFVDVAIPCNNRGRQAIGMLYWMLAREVLRMRSSIARSVPWEVKVDLFFYRDPEDVLKKEEDTTAPTGEITAPTYERTLEGQASANWGEDAGNWESTDNTNWSS